MEMQKRKMVSGEESRPKIPKYESDDRKYQDMREAIYQEKYEVILYYLQHNDYSQDFLIYLMVQIFPWPGYARDGIIEHLLDHRKVDLHAQQDYLLFLAVKQNDVWLVQTLLKHGANPITRYSEMVQVAIRNQNPTILQLLETNMIMRQ